MLPFLCQFCRNPNCNTPGVTFTWKYLEVGHTYMECDSVHRCIEQRVACHDVNVPHDYVNIIKRARKNPCPYEVRYDDILPYSFFLDYESQQDVPSIRPGNRIGDPTVNDLRQIRYTPDGVISYKLSHSHREFTVLPIMKKLKPPTYPLIPNLYKKPLPISYKKYQHLKELKQTIPQFFHPYYENLPHLPPAPPKKEKK